MARVNLHYARAAIEANTGIFLSISQVKDILLDEGIIDAYQAEKSTQPLYGYGAISDFDDRPSKYHDIDPEELDFSH